MGWLTADGTVVVEAMLLLGWLVFAGEVFDIPAQGGSCTLAQAVNSTAEPMAVSLSMPGPQDGREHQA